MSCRSTGGVLIAVAAFLYATRFVSAAIWGSGFSSWNAEHFTNLLGYVDQGLTNWSVIALVFGIAFLVWSEIDEFRR